VSTLRELDSLPAKDQQQQAAFVSALIDKLTLFTPR
jgi:hypothetical protein